MFLFQVWTKNVCNRKKEMLRKIPIIGESCSCWCRDLEFLFVYYIIKKNYFFKKTQNLRHPTTHVTCHILHAIYHLSQVICPMSNFMCHMSHVTHPMSDVPCHISHITGHMSPVLRHKSHVTNRLNPPTVCSENMTYTMVSISIEVMIAWYPELLHCGGQKLSRTSRLINCICVGAI